MIVGQIAVHKQQAVDLINRLFEQHKEQLKDTPADDFFSFFMENSFPQVSENLADLTTSTMHEHKGILDLEAVGALRQNTADAVLLYKQQFAQLFVDRRG